jgi:hypothetical protein
MENRVLELKLGTNRVGRSSDTDFTIPHPTVSSLHCELVLKDDGVIIRDLESTNGTFVDGRPIRESRVCAGQTVRLGDVELFVEDTELKVAIPKFIDTDLPAPPMVFSDGTVMCPRHAGARATHRCTHCQEVMCDGCVHHLRRKGAKNQLSLCPVCSHVVEPIDGVPKPRRRSLLARVGETVKMKLTRSLHLGSGP